MTADQYVKPFGFDKFPFLFVMSKTLSIDVVDFVKQEEKTNKCATFHCDKVTSYENAFT